MNTSPSLAHKARNLFAAALTLGVAASGIGLGLGVDSESAPASASTTGHDALRTSITNIARAELAKSPAETNGNNVVRYNNGTGAHAPYNRNRSWCADFATWVWQQAGVGNPMMAHCGNGTAGTIQTWAASNTEYRPVNQGARVGDLMLIGSPNNCTHVTIVVAVRSDGAVQTIGGNESNRVLFQNWRNPAAAGAYGFASPVKANAAAPLPALVEGGFVKTDSSATVYRITGGAPVPISSMTLVTTGYATVSQATLNSLFAANPHPKEGTFVKSDTSATVYRITRGGLTPLTSMTQVTGPIVVLNETSLTWIRNNNPFANDSRFVKSDSSATVYRMTGGTPVPISSMSLVTTPIYVVPQTTISSVLATNPHPKDGTFVKSDTSATVYRVTNRALTPLTSMTQVTGPIVVLNETSLTWIRNNQS